MVATLARIFPVAGVDANFVLFTPLADTGGPPLRNGVAPMRFV